MPLQSQAEFIDHLSKHPAAHVALMLLKVETYFVNDDRARYLQSCKTLHEAFIFLGDIGTVDLSNLDAVAEAFWTKSIGGDAVRLLAYPNPIPVVAYCDLEKHGLQDYFDMYYKLGFKITSWNYRYSTSYHRSDIKPNTVIMTIELP
jgi:hypothetical protein